MTIRGVILSVAAIGAVTVVALPAAGAATTGRAAGPARAGCLKVQTLTFTRAQDTAALRYWTPARIRASRGFSQAALGRLRARGVAHRPAEGARPASATQCAPEAGLSRWVGPAAPHTATPHTATPAVAAPRAASPGAPRAASPGAARATASSGYPTIGKLTFDADGVLSLNCTATVINGTAAANHQELIVTAAHCIEGTTGGIAYTSTNLAFSPMWHDNTNPYGTWTVKKVFLNSGWMRCSIPVVDCHTNPLDDYAVIVLNSQHGKGVGDITGSDGWSINQPVTIDPAAIAGIPATSSGTLVSVAKAVTVTESGQQYREASTPGLTDGSSGGPWLRDFNSATGRGLLIGDTGGYEQGGPSSGSPSYADYWAGSFAGVVSDAVKYEG